MDIHGREHVQDHGGPWTSMHLARTSMHSSMDVLGQKSMLTMDILAAVAWMSMGHGFGHGSLDRGFVACQVQSTFFRKGFRI